MIYKRFSKVTLKNLKRISNLCAWFQRYKYQHLGKFEDNSKCLLFFSNAL